MSSQYSQLPLDDKEPVVKAQRSYILRHPVRTAILSLAAMVSLAFITGSSGQIATGCSRAFRVASKNESYILPSGDKIPSVALGVWKAQPGDAKEAVKTAVQAGYHHIDGAWIYRNEPEVGQGLKESGVARDKIWLTSKLWNSFHYPDQIEPALDETLKNLGVDYLDLYLIHWPLALKRDGKPYDKDLTHNPYPTWQKLEELVDKGKIRNIGVSNFNIQKIQNLTANPLKHKPVINQVEINWWFPQHELLEWSKANDILLEAYSPLGSDRRVKQSLEAPAIKKVATKLGLTPAQVIISWLVQRGLVVLPKSVTPSRIEENLAVSRLPDAEFEYLQKESKAHPPQRGSNPSKTWGLDFDIFA